MDSDIIKHVWLRSLLDYQTFSAARRRLRFFLVSYMPLAIHSALDAGVSRSRTIDRNKTVRLYLFDRWPEDAALSQPTPPCEQHKTRVLSKQKKWSGPPAATTKRTPATTPSNKPKLLEKREREPSENSGPLS